MTPDDPAAPLTTAPLAGQLINVLFATTVVLFLFGLFAFSPLV